MQSETALTNTRLDQKTLLSAVRTLKAHLGAPDNQVPGTSEHSCILNAPSSGRVSDV
jgi:hypothetical protein